jgi:hypothetical protein
MMLSYSTMQKPALVRVALVRISTKMISVKGEIVIEQEPDCEKSTSHLQTAQHFRLTCQHNN